MTFGQNLKSIFQANSGGLSSKRVCGVLGWLVCLVLFVWAFVANKQVPDFGDFIIIASSSMLGIDSLSNMFSKSVQK